MYVDLSVLLGEELFLLQLCCSATNNLPHGHVGLTRKFHLCLNLRRDCVVLITDPLHTGCEHIIFSEKYTKVLSENNFVACNFLYPMIGSIPEQFCKALDTYISASEEC